MDNKSIILNKRGVYSMAGFYSSVIKKRKGGVVVRESRTGPKPIIITLDEDDFSLFGISKIRGVLARLRGVSGNSFRIDKIDFQATIYEFNYEDKDVSEEYKWEEAPRRKGLFERFFI